MNRPVYIHRTAYLILIATFCYSALACHTQPPVEGQADPQVALNNVNQADQLYSRREDLTTIRQGIILLRQVHTSAPENYEAAWKLSKFNYYLATHTDNSEEREKALREGIDAGKAAVQLQDGKADGHFWLGANYGAGAQSSAMAGLASIGDIRGEMNRVLQINEGYQDGSAYMVLGLVDLQAPKMLGGDSQKAVNELEKGLPLGKTNALLRLHLAEAYLKVGRKSDASQQLSAILSMTPDQNYLPEYKEAVSQAQALMNQTSDRS